jgi:ribose 5-phosphate isomerase B
MNIAVAADHAGYSLKEQLKSYLLSQGNNVHDVGTFREEPVDYPDFGRKAAGLVIEGKAERAILICGSGIGMAMAANKIKGIRAANCTDTECALLSRQHNDANVLCLGARFLSFEKAKVIADTWLTTSFEGGRHERRVKKIDG